MINTVVFLLAQIDINRGDLEIPKTGTDSAGNPTDTALGSDIEIALQLAFGIMGAIAFLVIVVAGLQFVLSRGDAEKSARARNAIIYAAIGLGLSTLAFTIVRFVGARI